MKTLVFTGTIGMHNAVWNIIKSTSFGSACSGVLRQMGDYELMFLYILHDTPADEVKTLFNNNIIEKYDIQINFA